MPTQAQLVSTLTDVLQLAQEVFRLMGDATPIMVGEQYLREPGPGNPPRIVFVPEEGDGKLGPPLKLNAGYIASRTWTCDVAVRAAEAGSDAARFQPAYLLSARVMTVLKNLDLGHITLYPGQVRDDSPLAVDGATGAGERFYFTFASNIPQDPAVLAAIKLLTSVSPPDPDRPGGASDKVFATTSTVTVTR